MKTSIVLIFTVFTAASVSVHGSVNCPSGLPAELLLECNIAESSAQVAENGAGMFGSDSYNLSEKLQAWVDRQMQRDAERENTEPTGRDVAQQVDEH